MISFDFIADDDFRKSLESDWQELQSCCGSRAWKSVHVLAGSIVEALLIDCLSSSTSCTITQPELLKKDLAALIALCEDAKIMSERTAQLSTVIRSYRNLIHPGRVIRLKEKINEQSATIARSLVEITVSEVEEQKRKDYGYTASQIVKKVECDSTSLPILPHLINELKRHELERLLLKVLPERYFEIIQPVEGEPDARTLDCLGRCFRLAFDAAPIETRKAASEKFVSVVKEGESLYVQTYETIFFRAGDLQYLDKRSQDVVKAHLLVQLASDQSPEIIVACAGLPKYLIAKEVQDYIYALMKAIQSANPPGMAQNAASQVRREFVELGAKEKEIAKNVVRTWIEHWRKCKNKSALGRCADICIEILGEQYFFDDDEIPF
jgi:hypothetical protein